MSNCTAIVIVRMMLAWSTRTSTRQKQVVMCQTNISFACFDGWAQSESGLAKRRKARNGDQTWDQLWLPVWFSVWSPVWCLLAQPLPSRSGVQRWLHVGLSFGPPFGHLFGLPFGPKLGTKRMTKQEDQTGDQAYTTQVTAFGN